MAALIAVLLAVSLAWALRCWKAIFSFLRERHRRIRLGNAIYGPAALPVIGNVHQFPLCSSELTEFMIRESHKAVQQGETLLRWWLGGRLTVVPLNGEALRPLVESNTELGKGPNYNFFKLWFGESLATTSDDDRWRTHRKKLSPVFFFNALSAYVSIFDKHSKRLVEQLDQLTDGVTTDLYPVLKRVALDMIWEAAMGMEMNALYNPDQPHIRAADEFNTLVFYMWKNPFYWIKPIWEAAGYGKRTRKALNALKETSAKVIRERSERVKRNQQAKKAAVEDSFLDASDRSVNFLDILLSAKGQDALLLEELCEEVDTFMHAGYDTAAHTLAWSIWCLATNPHVQEKLYEELARALPEEDLHLTLDRLKELKYLDRCIKETMRIFPPIPFTERTLREDMEISGKLVPKGTSVFINPLVIHHNCKTYPNHDDFDPDNFLPERASQRNAYDYVPFSAGPRNCIGQKFATIEIQAVLAHLLRRYRFTTHHKLHDNPRASETVLRPRLGVPVRIERR